MTNPGLRLLAEDEEDLKIVSAHLQDAVLRAGDIAYLPRARRFVILFNRFCWECGEEELAAGRRMCTGLHFEHVLKAKASGVRQDKPDTVHELLAIRFLPGRDGAGIVELCLAGGGLIRLEVECIQAMLRDMAGPWPAKARPAHRLETNR